jgi:hypothetical protein
MKDRIHRLVHELGQWQIQPMDGSLRFRRFEAAGFGRDGAFAVVELDISGRLGNGFDRADAVLGVAHFHADAQSFDLHGTNLISRRRMTTDFFFCFDQSLPRLGRSRVDPE